MWFEWAVPWSTAEQVDFLFLVLSTMVIAAVPVVYGLHANLRDPLARAVLSGTGATATAFITLVVFTVAVHAGWAPPEIIRHWIVRGMYFTVAGGKAILLLAILNLLRVSRNQRKGFQKPRGDFSNKGHRMMRPSVEPSERPKPQAPEPDAGNPYEERR